MRSIPPCLAAAALHVLRGPMFAMPALLALICGCGETTPPPAAPPAEVSISRPLALTVTDAIDYTGTTAPLEQVEVRARVTGFLKEVHFAPRQKVEQGALLFTIDKDPFQNAVATAQATLAATRAQLDKAENDANRMQDLFNKGASSSEELRDDISKRDSLKAAADANEARLAQSRLELSWCEVRAPISGRVARQLLDPGNIITADTTVLTNIVNDDEIYVYFNASERDILTLRAAGRQQAQAAGKSATSQPEPRDLRWPVQIGLMTEEGFPHEGYLDYVAPALDAATGTQQVRAVFPNHDGVLLAGLFVRIHIPIGKPYNALAVSERALGSDQGQRYLFVVNDQNQVDYRPVTVGTLQEGMRVVSAGLKPEDRVVVLGMQRVRPGLTVKPVEAAMPGSTPEAKGSAAVPASAPAPGH
jgi:RND family efflux transporter MFP subunit